MYVRRKLLKACADKHNIHITALGSKTERLVDDLTSIFRHFCATVKYSVQHEINKELTYSINNTCNNS